MSIDEIVKFIKENPEKCINTEYHFKCGNLILWTANGFSSFRCESRSLTFWNKVKLWHAYKWYCNNYFVIDKDS